MCPSRNPTGAIPLSGKVRGMVYDVTSNDYVFGNIKTHFLP